MTKEIPLTRGKVTIVDDQDYARLVAMGKWRAQLCSTGIWYAVRSKRLRDGRWAAVMMHRVVLRMRGQRRVDHCDRDGLNNRRSNLRSATRSQNRANSKPRKTITGYKGVFRRKYGWMAEIGVRRHRIYLGHFKSADAAARAYDQAAREHFAEFAVLNFPQETRP